MRFIRNFFKARRRDADGGGPKPMNEAEKPEGVTRQAQEACWRWLDECQKLGWSVTMLPQLEGLWWAHHDKFGKWKTGMTTDEWSEDFAE